MRRKIEFKKRDKIAIINEKNISFQYDIGDSVTLGDKIYIQLQIPMNIDLGYDETHNVYCYNLDGEKVWQIKNSDNSSTFENLRIQNNLLLSTDFLGRQWEINKDNGEITLYSITK